MNPERKPTPVDLIRDIQRYVPDLIVAPNYIAGRALAHRIGISPNNPLCIILVHPKCDIPQAMLDGYVAVDLFVVDFEQCNADALDLAFYGFDPLTIQYVRNFNPYWRDRRPLHSSPLFTDVDHR